jgi:hypothetical protein
MEAWGHVESVAKHESRSSSVVTSILRGERDECSSRLMVVCKICATRPEVLRRIGCTNSLQEPFSSFRLLLVKQKFHSLYVLFDRAALRRFVQRLVLLFDVMLIIVVDVDICSLNISETCDALVSAHDLECHTMHTFELSLQRLTDIVSNLQR